MGKLSIIKKGVGICLYLIETAQHQPIYFPYDETNVINDNRFDDRYLFPKYWEYDKDIYFTSRKCAYDMRWHRGHFSSNDLLRDIVKTTIR